MQTTRAPAVAGSFYPADAAELRQMVRFYLAERDRAINTVPKALIVPHAGFIYSGPIAASAYALWMDLQNPPHRIILLGPSHQIPLRGIATSTATHFSTPLGNIPLDLSNIDKIANHPAVQPMDAAHSNEHSLEVQLPFLQTILTDFMLTPLVVGDTHPNLVCEVIDQLWGDSDTGILISSDLSHYHPYHNAQQRDLATSEAIAAFDVNHIHGEDACGKNPLNGFLVSAKRRGMKVTKLDLRNSGDTAGTRDSVVGYGAYAFEERSKDV